MLTGCAIFAPAAGSIMAPGGLAAALVALVLAWCGLDPYRPAYFGQYIPTAYGTGDGLRRAGPFC